MDPTNFRNGMNLLALLPTANAGDEVHVTVRWNGYRRLFAEDDGALFEAACLRGVQAAWKWFPTPMEIREQMTAIEDERRIEQERQHYAECLRLTEERAAREHRAFAARAEAAFAGVPLSEPPQLADLTERERATAVVNFAEEYLHRAKRHRSDPA